MNRIDIKSMLIHISLVLSIVMVIALPILKFVYGDEMRKWDKKLADALGVDASLLAMAVAAVYLAILVAIAVSRHLRRRRERSMSYRFPKA